MSVIKRKRKTSANDIFHHWHKVRKDITEFLLTDFGYRPDKTREKLDRIFSTAPDNSRAQKSKEIMLEYYFNIEGYYLLDERRVISECLREITKCIYLADNTPLTSHQEYLKRRMYQEEAIGRCYVLVQELQYVIETLPVDVNRYTQFSKEIQEGIDLIRAWRKSENKYKYQKDMS